MCQLCIVKSLELDIQALTSHQSFVTKYSGSFTDGFNCHTLCSSKKRNKEENCTIIPYRCWSHIWTIYLLFKRSDTAEILGSVRQEYWSYPAVLTTDSYPAISTIEFNPKGEAKTWCTGHMFFPPLFSQQQPLGDGRHSTEVFWELPLYFTTFIALGAE